MVGRPRAGVPRYVCPNVPGTDSCGGTATNAQRTDDHVRDMVLVALDSPKMRDALTRRPDVDPALDEAIRRDEDALVDLAAEKDDGIIDRGEYLSRRARIEARLDENRAKLARATRTEPLAGFLGTYDEMRARWEEKNTAQRRAIVAAVLHRVVVKPANPRKKWDPDRFEPQWKV